MNKAIIILIFMFTLLLSNVALLQGQVAIDKEIVDKNESETSNSTFVEKDGSIYELKISEEIVDVDTNDVILKSDRIRRSDRDEVWKRVCYYE